MKTKSILKNQQELMQVSKTLDGVLTGGFEVLNMNEMDNIHGGKSLNNQNCDNNTSTCKNNTTCYNNRNCVGNGYCMNSSFTPGLNPCIGQ